MAHGGEKHGSGTFCPELASLVESATCVESPESPCPLRNVIVFGSSRVYLVGVLAFSATCLYIP
jgi:hypothetical protein